MSTEIAPSERSMLSTALLKTAVEWNDSYNQFLDGTASTQFSGQHSDACWLKVTP